MIGQKRILDHDVLFCTHCGAKMDEEARFCLRCGEKMKKIIKIHSLVHIIY